MDHKAPLFDRTKHGGLHTTTRPAPITRKVWFVDSGAVTPTANVRGLDAIGYGENPDTPFLTLAYAVTQVGIGDVIYCMPGHAENLAADAAVNIVTAGVSVIGLGYGGSRPTFTATAIAGDFKMAAASGYIENLLFLSGIADTTGMLEISGADCTVKNCEMRESVGVCDDFLITTATADRLLIDGLIVRGTNGAGAVSNIALVGADDAEIKNCYLYGNASAGNVDLRTTLSARIWIHDCFMWTEHANDVNIMMTIAACTGTVGPNLVLLTQDDAGGVTSAVTGATLHMEPPVLVCNLDGEKGGASGWTASTDA